MEQTLLNSCKYSFNDLLCAVPKEHHIIDIKTLYSLPQKDRNIEVKKLCKLAGWYYKDIIGTDKIVYTAFSPYLKE